MNLNIHTSLWSFDTENKVEQVEETEAKEMKAFRTNTMD